MILHYYDNMSSKIRSPIVVNDDYFMCLLCVKVFQSEFHHTLNWLVIFFLRICFFSTEILDQWVTIFGSKFENANLSKIFWQRLRYANTVSILFWKRILNLNDIQIYSWSKSLLAFTSSKYLMFFQPRPFLPLIVARAKWLSSKLVTHNITHLNEQNAVLHEPASVC